MTDKGTIAMPVLLGALLAAAPGCQLATGAPGRDGKEIARIIMWFRS